MAGVSDRTEAAYWYWKAGVRQQPQAEQRWRELFHLADGCPLRPINPVGRVSRCAANNCYACHAQIPDK
jgi:hypothetical protein